MAVDASDSPGERIEEVTPVPASRYLASVTGDGHNAVGQNLSSSGPTTGFLADDRSQLPTPSPTPSPRSSSPSPAITDSSMEWDGSLNFLDGPKLSQSIEQIKPRIQSEMSPSETGLNLPPPISKVLPPHELDDIPEEQSKKRRKVSVSKSTDDKVLKLSPSEMEELTSAPESLPVSSTAMPLRPLVQVLATSPVLRPNRPRVKHSPSDTLFGGTIQPRPVYSSRATSTPPSKTTWAPGNQRETSPIRHSQYHRPEALNLEFPGHPSKKSSTRANSGQETLIPPTAQEIPLPPLLSTYLQLELASSRPSPLYIPRSSASEYPYESSKVKFERLLNFLLLPPQLEQVLLFGTFACLDAWLYTFTILPLRFMKALTVLIQWWSTLLVKEARFIAGFIYHGSGRMYNRQRGRGISSGSVPASRNSSRSTRPSMTTAASYQAAKSDGSQMNGNSDTLRTVSKSRSNWGRRHRRTKSQPSGLSSYHKADLLQGMVIICSCMILMHFDASRMYHSIRGQNTMKLYVIYNVLEVGDRLFAALGQDIFECLMSGDVLERGLDGRSRLLRPFGMFILALVYNVIHATALFYQVITLNVAVNSYSNALLTLLMSNQFVEIKGTVFKKIEKDNLFQLTCADIVERFQLWLMLIIIGLRNIVEVGGLSIFGSAGTGGAAEALNGTIPIRTSSILPHSFTILPNWAGEVLSPFLVVLGSELVVDWIKHSYIGKFNNVKPAVYQKYLDVLAKDYYTNAFVNQNLIKRLGLPVIPLSCLFIRASMQTYHMFLATHLPPPIPSTATSLSLESEAAQSSPVTTAAFEHFDSIIRKALGRSTFGTGDGIPKSWYNIGADDLIAFITMAIFFLGAFLVLLACKLVLGMLLLRFARNRYTTMTEREKLSLDTKGKRLGGWGMVEVDEEKRKHIYQDDPEGYKAFKEREKKAAEKVKEVEKGMDFGKVQRYEMVAKRIW